MNKNSIVLFLVFVCLLVINAFWYITGLEKEKPARILFSVGALALNGNCILYNQEGDSMLLSKQLSNKTLIYNFSRSSCPPCVKKDLGILNNISKHIGAENIIVITEYNDLRVFRVMSELLEVKFKNFNTTHSIGNKLESEYKNAPYFIVADSFGYILQEIVSRPELTESDDFFKDVLNEFN